MLRTGCEKNIKKIGELKTLTWSDGVGALVSTGRGGVLSGSLDTLWGKGDGA